MLAGPDRTRSSAALLGPVLVLTTLVVSIISSLGAPLIPTIATSFHDSLSTAQWSLTAGLLSGAVSAPIMGRLGDGPRRRATIIGGLAAVTAGGVLAALAGHLDELVVGRALQGTGLGLVPLAMATAREELPEERVGPMVALLSVSAAAGVGVGYPISGLIADAWGLSWAFWFGVLVSGVALVSVAIVVPASSAGARAARLDWVGSVLLAVALVPALVAVDEGTTWGWTSSRVLVLLVVSVVAFGVWSRQQLGAAAPLVELRLLRHPAVLAGNVCAFVLGVAMYMDLSAQTELVQLPSADGVGFGASVVVAGLILVPMSAMMLAGSRVLPAAVGRLGIRTVLVAGCLLVAVSSVFSAVLHGALWESFVMMTILGIGLGATFAAIPGLIVQAVPRKETGSAMGFYQVVRYAGFSLGSALTACVLASRLSSSGQPTTSAYVIVFWLSATICVLAAFFVWMLPSGDRPALAADRLEEGEVRLAEQTDGDDLIVASTAGPAAHSGRSGQDAARR